MTIEEVEALAEKVMDALIVDPTRPENAYQNGFEQAITALRAEAWYPIERAEEMDAKDGRWVLGWATGEFWDVRWNGQFWTKSHDDIALEYPTTHFRFINPPEATLTN